MSEIKLLKKKKNPEAEGTQYMAIPHPKELKKKEI